ncbi:histidine kinase [Pseudomonas sp. ODNR1LW]|nr:histidine kinase [Pseudomonas sp. ODNR1LW]
MIPISNQNLSRFRDFLRTPSLVRSITAMLVTAFVLLIGVNVASFLIIQRTANLNQAIVEAQAMRRAARTAFIAVLNAETAQRGYLLTGRAAFLQPFETARAEMAPAFVILDEGAAKDPSLEPYTASIHSLADAKFDEMDRTLALTQSGRIGQAIQLVRSGPGKRYMDEFRATIDAFDDLKSARIAERNEISKRLGVLNLVMNAVAGLLVLVLALLSAWVVRRYVGEIQRAREELDAVNAGLEDTVRDRTAALTRANDEIQRFAYIVSHDLRAPLVNVMGYTSELEQAGKTIDKAIAEVETRQAVAPDVVMAVREEMPEAIGFIRASTAKMDRLINAILKLSREGRRNPLPEPLDMTAMARNIADSVHHQTEASGARILVEDLPSVESDRLSMEQIFGNLIDNAVKYLDADRPGEIVVSGEEVAGGWVVYRVSDNGRGIAPRDHERIFELFRRSGKQDRAGEGLGLAFVRNSVRRIGGTIDVESELGKGSTFLLKFPKRLILSEPGGLL